MGYIVKLVCRAAGVGSDEAPCFRRATVKYAVRIGAKTLGRL